MTLKSPEASSVNVNKNTQAILNKIAQQAKEKERRNGYTHVATGVLQRLGIQQHDRDLSTLLGDCTNRTNQRAVEEWLIENDPSMQFFGREEIEHYASLLWNVLDEYFDM